MRRLRVLIISAGFAIVSALSNAQTPPEERNPKPSSGTEDTMGMGGGMREMMESCRQRFDAMMQAVERARTSSKEAARSNDPERMRTALKEVQGGLEDMKADAARCQDLMGRMNGMAGDSASEGTMPRTGGEGCDVMCREMMQMEMRRWGWMAPGGIILGILGASALALLVGLEVLWFRHWLRRLREPVSAARS